VGPAGSVRERASAAYSSGLGAVVRVVDYDRYGVEIGRAAVRLVRTNVGPPLTGGMPRGRELGEPEKAERELSKRSLARLRWQINTVPLEKLGARPAIISFTYPRDWRRWAGDAQMFERHRRALVERWRREHGPLVGIWKKEFQARGAPHWHMVTGLPASVSESEYAWFQRRCVDRRGLINELGYHTGSGRTPGISVGYRGGLATWLCESWSQVVGTHGVDRYHYGRGVDVSVPFWNDRQERTMNREVLAGYIAREFGKREQTIPPEGFGRLWKWWGRWGAELGFVPEVQMVPLPPETAAVVEELLVRWVRRRIEREGGHWIGESRRRRGDGVVAYGLRRHQAERLLYWAKVLVAHDVQLPGDYGWPGGDEGAAGCGIFSELQEWEEKGVAG
jgi:hypothetical protein